MFSRTIYFLFLLLIVAVVRAETATPIDLQEVGKGVRQWGRRPANDSTLKVSPPGFVWFPQRGIVSWEVEVSSGEAEPFYRTTVDGLNVHRPPVVFPAGQYAWRYRGLDAEGNATGWSEAWRFAVGEDSQAFALPPRADLLGRVPASHPRLYVSAETLPLWKEKMRGPLRGEYSRIEAQSRMSGPLGQIVEPLLNSPDSAQGTLAWYRQYAGNFGVTNRASSAVYNQAFVGVLSDDAQALANSLALFDRLLAWDPQGATSLKSNSDSSYAYLSGISRAYTLLYDKLDENQRRCAREVLTVRGRELYENLLRHNRLWSPFNSHFGRMWIHLAEVAVVLRGDVPEADDWLWYAMNVFASVYPIWGGEDGGWHQGAFYQASYLEPLFYWSLLMRQTFGLNPFSLSPGLAEAGYFALYSLPPNRTGGGWGDQARLYEANSSLNIRTLETIARLSGNGHYVDYANRVREQGDIGFSVVGQIHDLFLLDYPLPKAVDIAGLPPSRVFAGTGQAVFNTSLTDASESVQVQFKSSDFYGTLSHGYDSNNAFLVWAYGENMLIKTGVRDWYESPHHQGWTRSTRAFNAITVGGKGQLPLSQNAKGRIVDSHLSGSLDIVVGEAADAYLQAERESSLLSRFTRCLIFIKPATLVVVDYVQARQPQHFEFWLHASQKFSVSADGRIGLDVDGVGMAAAFLEPRDLKITQTDQYDPAPMGNVSRLEWHLTAVPETLSDHVRFITVYTFSKKGSVPAMPACAITAGGKETTLRLADAGGSVALIRLPVLDADGLGGDRISVRLEAGGNDAVEASVALGLRD